MLSILYPAGFHVLLHAVQRIELQSFVQRIAVLQLPHGRKPSLDEDIHSQLKFCETAEVEVAVALRA